MIPMWRVPKSQPKRAVWTTDHLCAQHAEYFSKCIDLSSKSTYRSGFNSYLSFCYRHEIDLDPTPNTLSWFIVYMAWQTGPSGHLISIWTISSYLSGISHHLLPFYPHVLDSRRHSLVTKTLRGAEKMEGQPITRKSAINDQHLLYLLDRIRSSSSYDDWLFLAICFTAYHGLL